MLKTITPLSKNKMWWTQMTSWHTHFPTVPSLPIFHQTFLIDKNEGHWGFYHRWLWLRSLFYLCNPERAIWWKSSYKCTFINKAVVKRHLKSGAELEEMFTAYSAIYFQSQTCGYFLSIQLISVKPQMVCPAMPSEWPWALASKPVVLCYMTFKVHQWVTMG